MKNNSLNQKNSSFKKVILTGLFSFLILSANAQNYSEIANYGEATVTENGCVTINDSYDIREFYVIDISSFNFSNYKEAANKFGVISNNYLTYRVDFENQVAYLKIHTERRNKPETATWWKEYILGLCS